MTLPEGTKYDGGKTRLDLLSPIVLTETADVLTFGAEKYDAYNWAKGILYSRVYAALQRHLNAWWSGEELDAESKMPHLAHANCCLMFLHHYDHYAHQFLPFDDRPNYAQENPVAQGARNATQELSRSRRLSREDLESAGVVIPRPGDVPSQEPQVRTSPR